MDFGDTNKLDETAVLALEAASMSLLECGRDEGRSTEALGEPGDSVTCVVEDGSSKDLGRMAACVWEFNR